MPPYTIAKGFYALFIYLFFFCFQTRSQIFYRPVSPLFMLIYISMVGIEMPSKSNNILNVSQIDLQFAYT